MVFGTYHHLPCGDFYAAQPGRIGRHHCHHLPLTNRHHMLGRYPPHRSACDSQARAQSQALCVMRSSSGLKNLSGVPYSAACPHPKSAAAAPVFTPSRHWHCMPSLDELGALDQARGAHRMAWTFTAFTQHRIRDPCARNSGMSPPACRWVTDDRLATLGGEKYPVARCLTLN